MNNFLTQGLNIMFIGKLKIFCLTIGIAVSVAAISATAEDSPSISCSSAANLVKEGDIAGALEEARWCVTQLEQLMQEQVSSFFPDEVNGYTAGKIKKEQAMGMAITECNYSKDDNVISVSLTGAGSSGSANAFSAIAMMGAQMGGMGQKTRIQKRSAVIIDEDNSTQVVVTLKSGGILTFESRGASSDTVVAFAKKFPVAKLDDSRN